FLRAVAKGWKDVIADPDKGAAMVVKRNPAADVELEARRLKLSIDANVVTDYTKANGLGKIDKARMEKAMMQLGENSQFKAKPDIGAIFTDAYLPTDGSLKIN
ncbi:MAG: taurine ABC transporter permease, partial [Rhodospirillaceae bacterium]